MGKKLRGTMVIANNIFDLNGHDAASQFISSQGIVPKCLNNLYFAADAQKKNWASGRDKSYTLGQWQAHVQEEGTVFGDPLFVDAERGDFRLKPGRRRHDSAAPQRGRAAASTVTGP